MICEETKKAGVLIVTLSILNLLGCGYLDKDTAKTIEAKLHEKYGNSFAVTSIGNRYGTGSNDTVTAFCQSDEDDSFSFTVKMISDKTLLFDDYVERSVCTKISQMIEDSFVINSVKVFAFVSVFGGNKSESNDASITIDEYISSCNPSGFSADIILEDSCISSNLNNAVITIYNSFVEIKNRYPRLIMGTELRFLPSSQFENCGKALMEEARISNTWFNDYEITQEIIFGISEIGLSGTYDELFSLIAEKG
jgi:hypothetical protein